MNIKQIFAATLCWAVFEVGAQNCILPVSVRLDEDFSQVPPAASTVLYRTLDRIATENGLTTEAPSTPFILTAHCDVLDKSNLPGPPVQTVCNLGLTLYMADTYTQKKFATAYLTLDGVGTGEVKCYINAFRHITSDSGYIKRFIEKGKSSMMQYYDSQYENILKEARQLVSLQRYEEALALVLSVPVCSKGGDKAAAYGVQIYSQHLDRMNLFLLNRCRALWAAGQDAAAAREACALLAQIDPDAACYGEASALMAEIKRQVRSDIDFEMREKYRDQVDLEQQRIECARAVGVAYGKGQQPSTTNLMWLK